VLGFVQFWASQSASGQVEVLLGKSRYCWAYQSAGKKLLGRSCRRNCWVEVAEESAGGSKLQKNLLGIEIAEVVKDGVDGRNTLQRKV